MWRLELPSQQTPNGHARDGISVGWFFYVNLTQAKVTGEEGASVEKMPPKIWLQVSL